MARRAIFYDTETTGIKAERDRIIEIAAYDPEREAYFEEFVNPGMPIPAEATAIHHITDDMVAAAPNFGEISKKFEEFCQGEVVLIAHNNDAFDVHFLRHEYSRCSRSMPDWQFLDSLKWARKYRPDLPRHTLQNLREIYGIAANNAHRALDDVIVLHQVFKGMTQDLTIDQIFALLHKPKEIQHMPFGKHQGVPLQQVPKSYLRWLDDSGALAKPENLQLRATFEKLGMLETAVPV